MAGIGSAAAVIGWPSLTAAPLSALGLLSFQGLAAGFLGLSMGLASWWLPLQIALPFALASSLLLEVPAWSYLAVFTILLLVFWNAAGERVPLYLSNATTCRALGDLLPQGRSFAFIDLGCGLGGVLTRLAKNRKGRFFGIETAPLPFVFSWLRALLFDRKRLAIYRASLWDQDLSQFDVVYCFLSPEPMPTLFEKAKAEMKPGSLFISNSFRVPDYPADKILTLGDRRATQLHIWRF